MRRIRKSRKYIEKTKRIPKKKIVTIPKKFKIDKSSKIVGKRFYGVKRLIKNGNLNTKSYKFDNYCKYKLLKYIKAGKLNEKYREKILDLKDNNYDYLVIPELLSKNLLSYVELLKINRNVLKELYYYLLYNSKSYNKELMLWLDGLVELDNDTIVKASSYSLYIFLKSLKNISKYVLPYEIKNSDINISNILDHKKIVEYAKTKTSKVLINNNPDTALLINYFHKKLNFTQYDVVNGLFKKNNFDVILESNVLELDEDVLNYLINKFNIHLVSRNGSLKRRNYRIYYYSNRDIFGIVSEKAFGFILNFFLTDEDNKFKNIFLKNEKNFRSLVVKYNKFIVALCKIIKKYNLERDCHLKINFKKYDFKKYIGSISPEDAEYLLKEKFINPSLINFGLYEIYRIKENIKLLGVLLKYDVKILPESINYILKRKTKTKKVFELLMKYNYPINLISNDDLTYLNDLDMYSKAKKIMKESITETDLVTAIRNNNTRLADQIIKKYPHYLTKCYHRFSVTRSYSFYWNRTGANLIYISKLYKNHKLPIKQSFFSKLKINCKFTNFKKYFGKLKLNFNKVKLSKKDVDVFLRNSYSKTNLESYYKWLQKKGITIEITNKTNEYINNQIKDKKRIPFFLFDNGFLKYEDYDIKNIITGIINSFTGYRYNDYYGKNVKIPKILIDNMTQDDFFELCVIYRPESLIEKILKNGFKLDTERTISFLESGQVFQNWYTTNDNKDIALILIKYININLKLLNTLTSMGMVSLYLNEKNIKYYSEIVKVIDKFGKITETIKSNMESVEKKIIIRKSLSKKKKEKLSTLKKNIKKILKLPVEEIKDNNDENKEEIKNNIINDNNEINGQVEEKEHKEVIILYDNDDINA